MIPDYLFFKEERRRREREKKKEKDKWTDLKKKVITNALWQIPVSYGSMLHIPPTNYYILAAKQEPYYKAYLLTKKILKNLLERAQENGPVCRKKRQGRKSTDNRQKNNRGDSKVK